MRCYYECDCILLEEASDTYTDPISLKEIENVIVDLLSDHIERDKKDIGMLIVVGVDWSLQELNKEEIFWKSGRRINK